MSASIIDNSAFVEFYNNLPYISNADARFEEQLVSAGLTRGQLFSYLAPLFLESPHTGRYAVSLLHRHFSLNIGERMVTTGLRTRPSTDTSTNIVAELWTSSGQEVEHRFTDDPTSLPPPPPVNFLAKFGSILDSHGIDVLGVCYAPDKVADGFIFLETDGLEDRERVTTIVPQSARSDQDQCFDVTWFFQATQNSLGPSYNLIVAACCVGAGCLGPNCPPPP